MVFFDFLCFFFHFAFDHPVRLLRTGRRAATAAPDAAAAGPVRPQRGEAVHGPVRPRENRAHRQVEVAAAERRHREWRRSRRRQRFPDAPEFSAVQNVQATEPETQTLAGKWCRE